MYKERVDQVTWTLTNTRQHDEADDNAPRPCISILMTSNATKRTTASSRTASRATTMSTDKLARQLASRLTISNNKGKQKASATPTQDEIRVCAMKAVNSASQALSTVVQSGWKKSSGKASPPSVATSVAAAVKNLSVLRQICPDDVDIERAAMSLLGKLVALELYDDALVALGDLHRRLCFLTNVSASRPNSSSRLHLLSLPFFASDSSGNTTLLTVISTYLTYSVAILVSTMLPAGKPKDDPSVLEALATAFTPVEPTLLEWIPRFSGLPAKQLDPLLTRTYSTIIKACSSARSNPRATFSLRIYASACLAHTSSGTVEPDTFWDQILKFGSAFVKSQTVVEDEAIQVVLSAFSDIVMRIEKRRAEDYLLSGKGFIGFCEFWITLAKKGGDICLVDRVAALIQGNSTAHPSNLHYPPALTGDIKEHEDDCILKKDWAALEAPRLCAVFVQMTTVLEQHGSDMTQRLRETSNHLQNGPLLRALIQNQKSEDEEWVRIGGKVDRALERMRRASIAYLESFAADPGDDVHEAVHCILDAIKNVLSPLCITPSPDPDILTRTLDTIFVLAKSKLKPANPRTHVPAHEYLLEAVSIVQPIPLSNESIDTPNYVRCISGAFHNLAGTMYQAGRHGTAIGLLKEACGLGVKALEMRRARNGGLEGVKERSKTEEGWKQLEEQVYRRWELLGVCYSKIGERKAALEAFLECIRTFPYSTSGFIQAAAEANPGVLFDVSSGTKHLASIIDRVTHLSACELLMEPAKVSLVSLGVTEDAVVGALLERQIGSLETSRWQEGVPAVVEHLLKDALQMYGARRPVRRSRTLLKCLEFMYQAGPDQMSNLGRPEDLGQEIVELLQRQSFGDDVQLVPFCAQYQAMTHLWLALHAHRRVDAAQSSLMTYHSSEACKILKTLVVVKVEAKKTPRKSSPKQISVTKKSTLPPPVSRQRSTRRAAVRDPVTPKPKSRKALQPVSLNAVTPPRPTANLVQPSLLFDDFDRLISLLHLVARLAGLLALILPKVHILDMARRLCEYQLDAHSDAYILASIDLASEYVILGKTRRAGSVFNRVLEAVKSNKTSDEVRVSFFLRFAEFLALAEDISRSSTIYCEALTLSETVDFEDKTLPMFQRVRTRVMRLEKAAVASRVVALIQYQRDDVRACIDGLLQSLRLWNRAIDALTRLGPQVASPSKTPEESNPFEVVRNSSPEDPPRQPKGPEPTKKTFARRPVMDGLEWRVSEGLLTTLFSLSQAYLNRGSAREAEYFVQQAQDLAESLNAPTMVSRALAKKGEIQLYQRQFEASLESLTRAAELVQDTSGIDSIDVQRLRGIYNERMAMQVDASAIYEETLNMLKELDQTFKQFDGVAFGRKSIGSSPNNTKSAREVILPDVLAAILRQRIWLLRDNNVEDYTAFLDTFLSLPPSSRTKAEENALMAKLTLHAAYGRFRGDMFLSSLAESTIAVPMGMSSKLDLKLSRATQDVLATLDAAEKHFWENLSLIGRRGKVADVRETVVSLALIQAFQTSLGKSSAGGPTLAIGLLDASAAITLRREMLETIQHKFPCEAHDDMQWPLITPDGLLLPRTKTRKSSPRYAFDDVLNGNGNLDDNGSLKDYWNAVHDRYQSQILEPTSLSSTPVAGLPSSWTVIHINVTEDRNTLFITRQECGDTQRVPLMFCVPLKGRRDDGSGAEDEEHLTFEHAINELNNIIKLSNQGTKAAVHVNSDDLEARAAWWKERGELDTRLRELLENIEFCWLGAFKTILSPRLHLSPKLVSDLRSQFEKVFSRSLHVQDKTKPRSRGHKKTPSQSPNQSLSQVSFDDALLECFATLSPKCRDEELEDLVYFILDLYQFHGVPVAIAEVDVTQVVVDLRTALEDFSQKLSRHRACSPERSVDKHTFLILDKNLQGIPWESMPILRGRSVSRIPSLDFLHDRVLFASWKTKSLGTDTPQACPKGAVVDPRKGYFILNPSGDLARTQGRFQAWTKEMQEVGWSGVTGHPPSEQQFLNALRDQDLVVYFGHGGGEQYVRSHKIRNLPTCAATMLWGCSSGNLKDMGDFDRLGTPYHYMLAGCPSLVANLWDVTDRDIDKFSQSVFDKLLLNAIGVKQWTEGRRGDEVSVVNAVATSRDACKLKYLTGAAPVVYGIPFYL